MIEWLWIIVFYLKLAFSIIRIHNGFSNLFIWPLLFFLHMETVQTTWFWWNSLTLLTNVYEYVISPTVVPTGWKVNITWPDFESKVSEMPCSIRAIKAVVTHVSYPTVWKQTLFDPRRWKDNNSGLILARAAHCCIRCQPITLYSLSLGKLSSATQLAMRRSQVKSHTLLCFGEMPHVYILQRSLGLVGIAWKSVFKY